MKTTGDIQSRMLSHSPQWIICWSFIFSHEIIKLSLSFCQDHNGSCCESWTEFCKTEYKQSLLWFSQILSVFLYDDQECCIRSACFLNSIRLCTAWLYCEMSLSHLKKIRGYIGKICPIHKPGLFITFWGTDAFAKIRGMYTTRINVNAFKYPGLLYLGPA